jgi:hypothetical protein
MADEYRDSGTLGRIAALLLSLALLAERAAGRSFPVRFLVLILLRRAEAVARAFVAREIEAGGPCPDVTCPDVTWPDLNCLDEPPTSHYGAAEAVLLALRLRILAAVLGALAGAVGDSDDRFADGPAGWSAALAPCAVNARHLPIILVVRLPACCRRPSRPP